MDDALTASAYLLEKDLEKKALIAKDVAAQIETKALKFSAVIASMKDPLFSEDAIQRAEAIQYVAAILENSDPGTLSRIDVSLLVGFLLSRFEHDRAGVKDTTKAIRILHGMKRFDPHDAPKISSKIFQFLTEQFPKETASTRLEVYKLLDSLLSDQREEMRSTGSNFIEGLLELCVREGDPRNLMICFSMIQVVLAEWDMADVTKHIQDLWDAVSRYFPITFRPKPNEPIGITADDLKVRLRNCISATSSFAPLAFPFLIQKLDDQTTANVKKDIMRTMTACIVSFEPQISATWYMQLWDCLKYEVFNATEDELAAEAAATLSSVAARLSFGLTIQTMDDTPLLRYINAVTKDCNDRLHEKGQRTAKAAGQMLSAVAAASPFAYHLIIRDVMPKLINAYQNSNSTIAEKRQWLEVSNEILDAKFKILETQESLDFPFISIVEAISDNFPADAIEGGGLRHHRDALGHMYVSVLTGAPRTEISYRLAALQGLLKLVMMPLFLESAEVGLYIGYFNQCLLDQDRTDEKIRDQAIQALQQSANLHPGHIVDLTFPALLGTLPDVLQNDDQGKIYLPVLEALAKIASRGRVFETFARRLLNKLDVVIRSNSSLNYAHVILVGILYGFQQRELASSGEGGVVIDTKQYQWVVETLLQKVTTWAIQDEGGNSASKYVGLRSLEISSTGGPVYPDQQYLVLTASIVMIAVRCMSLNDQQWITPEVSTFFARATESPVAESGNLNLLKAPENQLRTLILSTYILAGLRRENVLPFDSQVMCNDLIRCLGTIKILTSDVRLAMSQQVALLVNKYNATSGQSSATEKPQDLVQGLIAEIKSRPDDEAKNILHLLTNFTAAANFKGDRCSAEMLQLFLNGLEDARLGGDFARCFGHLIAASDLLCKQNFAIIRPLYKQRVFGICVPSIVERFKACKDATIKVNYLTALSGILKHTPSDIVLPEIETLLPLLLQGLETPGNAVKSASIDVINVAIVQASDAVEPHIQGIIKRLMNSFYNTKAEPSSCSAEVRAKALICLGAIPMCLRLIVILPYKSLVLQKLSFAVNDDRRKVRTEAVDCQMTWFNLAEPTEDED